MVAAQGAEDAEDAASVVDLRAAEGSETATLPHVSTAHRAAATQEVRAAAAARAVDVAVSSVADQRSSLRKAHMPFYSCAGYPSFPLSPLLSSTLSLNPSSPLPSWFWNGPSDHIFHFFQSEMTRASKWQTFFCYNATKTLLRK